MKGPNKLLLEFDGKSLVRHTYEELTKSGITEIIVVTGRDEEQVRKQLVLRSQDHFVHNPDFAQGMTTSIQKGVALVGTNAIMVCLADMPELKAAHYNELIETFELESEKNSMAILVPVVNGKRGNPVIFSGVYKPAILAHMEMNGCRKLVKDNQKHLSEYITDDLAYLSDIDTAEDYHKLHE